MAVVHEVISTSVYFLAMIPLGFVEFTSKTLPMIWKSLPSAIFDRTLEYWVIIAIFLGIDYQRKFRSKQLELAQMENKLSDAQLRALRLQLQPHFLFNTLNTISSLMEINIKNAQKIVVKLGNLLRTVLDKNKRQQVLLKEEVEFIRSYLDIEQVRFHDRLTIDYEIEEECLSCYVPSMILQPLVENAVKHGFSKKAEKGRIEIGIKKRNRKVFFSVADDGLGSDMAASALLSNGLGLRNVKDRLELIYGDQADFNIEASFQKGFKVSFSIPCQRNIHEKDQNRSS